MPSRFTEDDDGAVVSAAKRFCFWSSDDAIVAYLITQVFDGTKTATVCPTSSSGIPRNAFDDARFNIGDCGDLLDNKGYVHARLRITDV